MDLRFQVWALGVSGALGLRMISVWGFRVEGLGLCEIRFVSRWALGIRVFLIRFKRTAGRFYSFV